MLWIDYFLYPYSCFLDVAFYPMYKYDLNIWKERLYGAPLV